jgi:hypothetical protein
MINHGEHGGHSDAPGFGFASTLPARGIIHHGKMHSDLAVPAVPAVVKRISDAPA